eukprot:m.127522 g.127522  ORF g.127522 m.127522 type:complete len:367 (-) comp16367_c0_seq2:1831-2931(-)
MDKGLHSHHPFAHSTVEAVMSMVDVVNEQEEIEAEAAAVFGDIDDDLCTYPHGYVGRQPLWSCLTCRTESGGVVAGVCLACSLHCHDGHELQELWTKRNFRCDCGNSRFAADFKCHLQPKEKAQDNDKNSYNQNFEGLYCVCHRPYPDPEDKSNDQDMAQCVVCEDWFHANRCDANHPQLTLLPSDSTDSLICASCVEKSPLLWHYEHLRVTDPSASAEPSSAASARPQQQSLAASSCQRPQRLSDNPLREAIVFRNLRTSLCTCNTCQEEMKAQNILFLLDSEDTIAAFEERGKERTRASVDDSVARALSVLPQDRQVNVVQGYRHLMDTLREFFQEKISRNETVTEADIKQHFESLQEAKRRRF